MYFRINKSFLNERIKADLLSLFRHLQLSDERNKQQLIRDILLKLSHDERLGNCIAWFCICPYCRGNGFLILPAQFASSTMRFCTQCGKTSPSDAFNNTVTKTSQLALLASKMNRKEEKGTKSVLLEQALVSVITGLEVLMREVYAIIYDHQHVIFGHSVFDDTYARTRNEFLNLGSASRWINIVTNLNIKKQLAGHDYSFLSRMYSARHIVVHNCSIKDRDFLSQTGEPDTELNKPLLLIVSHIRKLIAVAKRLARLFDQELRSALLVHHHENLTLVRQFTKETRLQKSQISIGLPDTPSAGSPFAHP